MKNIGEIIKNLRENKKMTQEELAHKVGYTSRAAINRIEKGTNKLKQEKITTFATALDCSVNTLLGLEPDYSSVTNIVPLEKAKKLPILGTICAGNGIWCEENYDEYIIIDKNIRADFALRVKGDSMIDANIHNGDTAFFKKQNTAENGQIVAVLLTDENEATLKKVYYFEDGTTILQPCNPSYNPIITNDFMILGLLKGVYRDINQ